MLSDEASAVATSKVIGTILMVALTILLALLVLLMVTIPPLSFSTGPPAIFQVREIHHRSDRYPNPLNYDSRMVLVNNGSKEYLNDGLSAIFYLNGQLLDARAITLNGHHFISTHHVGIQWMGGSGCSGTSWAPGEQTVIDFTDGTFHPGDLVQIDVIDTSTDRVISRHSHRA